MAIDIKKLTQLITEFRALQAKDSITPESLGYLLQLITDYVYQISQAHSDNEKQGSEIKEFYIEPKDSGVKIILATDTDTLSVTIPIATTSNAGLISPTEKMVLNNIGILPFDGIYIEYDDMATIQPTEGIYFVQENGYGYFKSFGNTTFYRFLYNEGETADEVGGSSHDSARADKLFRRKNLLYHYVDGKLVKFPDTNDINFLTQVEPIDQESIISLFQSDDTAQEPDEIPEEDTEEDTQQENK